MPQTPKPASLTDALKQIFSGIAQLRELFPCKEFTIDGRLVGDIGEVIAQRDYDLTLFEGLEVGHDGYTPCGRKVQIKATFKNSLSFRTVPDYYLGFKLYKDGSYDEIFNGPGKEIEKKYGHREGFGKILMSFPNERLIELSAKVDSADKIKTRN